LGFFEESQGILVFFRKKAEGFASVFLVVHVRQFKKLSTTHFEAKTKSCNLKSKFTAPKNTVAVA